MGRGRKHSRLGVRALSCCLPGDFSRIVWVEWKVWTSRLERVNTMGVCGGGRVERVRAPFRAVN